MSDIAAEDTAVAEGESPRLLANVDGRRGSSFDAHLRCHGPLPVFRRADDLIALLRAAGLRGCGGANFPTARKLEAVAAARRRPVVVANGVEGEPASGKDKVLLAYAPHLVLDGTLLAARAVGASDAIVACSRSVQSQVAAAIAERGRDGSNDRVRLRVVAVPDRFVAGEETALVHFLDGGPPQPTFTPPRPFERGVGGAPTLVQNVETLAHIALIARHGPDWFRELGTPDEPGSTLVTVSGAVRDPGVYEVPFGRPLAHLITTAGGYTADTQSVLVGGYFGSWISTADAAHVRLADADLARVGASLGSRAIVALPSTVCGLVETARVMRYLAGESAGQCGPCAHGLAAVAGDVTSIANRDRQSDLERLSRRLAVISGRGACRHPDGAVRFVSSALRTFEGELQRHVRAGRCAARGSSTVLPVPAASRSSPR